MADEPNYDEMKEKVVAYLSTVGGKGADTTINIGKQVGLKRKAAMQVLRQMEVDGLVQAAGVMAGVAGYKLVK